MTVLEGTHVHAKKRKKEKNVGIQVILTTLAVGRGEILSAPPICDKEGSFSANSTIKYGHIRYNCTEKNHGLSSTRIYALDAAKTCCYIRHIDSVRTESCLQLQSVMPYLVSEVLTCGISFILYECNALKVGMGFLWALRFFTTSRKIRR